VGAACRSARSAWALSQSGGCSAEDACTKGINEGEAEWSRVVEAVGTTLTAHTMRASGRGKTRRIRAPVSIHAETFLMEKHHSERRKLPLGARGS
jgi:hypothetical protein